MAQNAATTAILDGDGHIVEDMDAILSRIPAELKRAAIIQASGPIPQLDNLHTTSWIAPPGSFERVGPEGWADFLDSTGFGGSVVYPTSGLGFCRIVDPDLAIEVARAYNDWLYDTYLSVDERIKGVALLPMQDPQAAAEELRRAVVELGMPAGMLPPNGLRSPLGSKEYWPVYEEADKLGCALGIHGGAHQDLGMNRFEVFAGTHALGHPFGLAIQLVDLAMNRVFDQFPNTRFGFLEGGLAWFLLVMERLPGSYGAFIPSNTRGRYLDLNGGSMADYLTGHLDAGRITVGVEGDEPALAYAVKTYGPHPFLFSSDFPHEVNKETIQHELDELYENEEVSDADREAILRTNAERFYKVSVPTA